MNWKASWIWTKGEESPRNYLAYFRKKLSIARKVASAKCLISVDSRYKLYVNGKYAGRGIAKCDPKWQYYDVHDIGKYLRKGENSFCVMAYHYGDETFSYVRGRGGLIFQAEIVFSDGEKIFIVSDSSWKCVQEKAHLQEAERTTVQLGFQEIFDARKEIVGWNKTGFNDATWDAPVVLGRPPLSPWDNLTEMDIPFLYEKRICPAGIADFGAIPQRPDLDNRKIAGQINEEPHVVYEKKNYPKSICKMLKNDAESCLIEIPENESAYILIDFGKEVSGYPEFTITAEEGAILDFGYDELLFDGRLCVNRGSGKLPFADRYIAREGYQTHQINFIMRAFRYMQVCVRNCKKIKIHSMNLNFTTYPVRKNGKFLSSDKLLNKIWDVGRYTLQLCMHDSYEDCPWREQAQWMGDARIEILVNYFTFGDVKLAGKCLRQIAESQRFTENGYMTPFAPGGALGSSVYGKIPVIPSFCLIWIISLWDYYVYTGDKKLLKQLYPNLKALIKGFRERLTENRLFKVIEGDWNFIDWSPLDIRGEYTAVNCFLAEALRVSAEISDLLKEDDSKQYLELRQKVIGSINGLLWYEKRQLYSDCIVDGVRSEVASQHSNCLAVLFDIAEESKQREIIERMLKDEKVVEIKTPYFAYYLLKALCKVGKHDVALNMIREKWSVLIEKGATTLREIFGEADRKNGSSLCHAWSSGPIEILGSEIVGIKSLAPGYSKFTVEPHCCGIDWIKTVVPTVYGDIKVEVRKERNKTLINVKSPKKCRWVKRIC